jgi:uncharacterized protein YjbJ (UPF0337 family)
MRGGATPASGGIGTGVDKVKETAGEAIDKTRSAAEGAIEKTRDAARRCATPLPPCRAR